MELIQTTDKGFGSYLVIENDLIGRYINHFGFWEAHLFSLYSSCIAEEDVVVDAGANIGFHTCQMAKRAKKVYAFEPQPLIYNILSANILLNDLSDKVKQFRVGLGAEKSTFLMQPLSMFDEPDGSHNFGGVGIDTETIGADSESSIEVDKLSSFVGKVDVLKIDIQGFELEAFQGMSSLFAIGVLPWIMLENYEGKEKDEQVLEHLKGFGYVIYRFTKGFTEDCVAVIPEKPSHKKVIQYLEETAKDFYQKIK